MSALGSIGSAFAWLAIVLGPQDSDVARRFAELDAARGSRSDELAAELVKLGAEAGRAALVPPSGDFDELALEARRARSGVLREAGGPAEVERAIAALSDPDRVVRANLVGFLASPALRSAQVAERVTAIERIAILEEPGDGRAVAIRGLSRIDDPAAAQALARLVLDSSGEAQLEAASALAGHARGGEEVVELVRGALAAAGRVSDRSLVALLSEGFGASLADRSGDRAAARDLASFALAARHPDGTVRLAGRMALERFTNRGIVLGRLAMVDAALAQLVDAGLDPFEVATRRIEVQLRYGGDPALALELASGVARAHPLDDDPRTLGRRATADLLAAAALLALGRATEAEPLLSDAEAALEALARERRDRATSGEELELDQGLEDQLLAALVPTWRAVIELSAAPNAAPKRALELARDADVALLEWQLAACRRLSGVGWTQLGEVSLDVLFEHPLGPTWLLFGGGRAGVADERWLALEEPLYRAFATVTRGVPGFERLGDAEPALADPLEDPERRLLLVQVRDARQESRWRELRRQARLQGASDELDDPRGVGAEALQQQFVILSWQLEKIDREELEEGDPLLRRLRAPSRAGIAFADRLRESNRHAQAKSVLERVAVDLEAQRSSMDDVDFARTLASAESGLGSVLMDMGSPVEAETTLQRALERLEGARKAFEKRSVGGRRSPIDSQIAGVLVSLAVNANVKLRNPDKAVEYFERAFEIDRSDFMRVLLACYRARVGRADEARAALRDVPVAPGNYYNLACTYALLGETELAIDFLKRDFDEVRTAAGARDRQKQWARDDPDLTSLREDPRFVELIRGPGSDKQR